MTNFLVIPGLGNSGPEHWQTWIEKTGSDFYRVNQTEWEAPICEHWVETIEREILKFNSADVVLIGHSLG
jgi:uncharacterized protein